MKDTRFVNAISSTGASLGNNLFRMEIAVSSEGVPVLNALAMTEGPNLGSSMPILPGVERVAEGVPSLAGLRFKGFTEADGALGLLYDSPDGIRVVHRIKPSATHPAWSSWTEVTCTASDAVEALTRFDALNLHWSAGEGEPHAAYVLGWMEGPRVDAPGRHSIPYQYDGWIPDFLYGPDYPIGPPPQGGWQASAYRLVQERLVFLPLRSGKRSTYENQPWAIVRDTERDCGIFVGFEWSGTWKIDIRYDSQSQAIGAYASSDGCGHRLAPGETIASPPAFMGLFQGDWDAGFNASRAYVADDIIPEAPTPWPSTIHCYFFQNYDGRRSDEYMRREIDAAAELGIETTYVEPNWWSESLPTGEFSVGLGDFAENRNQFPGGLRAMSDYVHGKGMRFGLWFEIERVDIRTANRLRNPWKPEWLVHQKGRPYRSWCQHAFLLCLGVRDAAEWALENVLWAVDAYNLDYIMFDGNEWAVCDDPTHDHGAADGEWAQIHGFYHVLEGVRKAHPNIAILNSSGGAQRGDFGIARYSTYIHPHDNQVPSARERRYIHGTGCLFPNGFQAQALPNYVMEADSSGWLKPRTTQVGPVLVDAKRYEWRLLSRIMGYLAIAVEASVLQPEHADVLKRGIAFYKRIRHALNGRRYVLVPPVVLFDPDYREADNWEAYQFVSREDGAIVVCIYRCLSPRSELTVRLREIDPSASYSIESFRGITHPSVSGSSLSVEGLRCELPEKKSADVYIVRRNSA